MMDETGEEIVLTSLVDEWHLANNGSVEAMDGDQEVDGGGDGGERQERDLSLFVSDERSDAPKRAIGMDNFRSTPASLRRATVSFPSMHTKWAIEATPQRFLSDSVASRVRVRWQQAAKKLKLLKDPWYEFHLDTYPIERVVRHRYNAYKKEWMKDECVVRMENQQFANGSMRACFRLKKLSKFAHTNSWMHASNNVAKCYRDEEVPRERYFDDVKLQMDAKLWAELYNRHNPPKKIDMFQMSILEFVHRPGSPLFHLEHYIEGKYIKYNSNAGFVDEHEHLRLTPHAFSHFTFESSHHELIVVDIQGVGDLYTDPQIHTAVGDDYGDGNLGTKGFALFFCSHICNDICKSLGLTQFDLAPSELSAHQRVVALMERSSGMLTRRRGNEERVAACTSATASLSRLYSKRLSEEDESALAECDEVAATINMSASDELLRMQLATRRPRTISNEAPSVPGEKSSFSSASNMSGGSFMAESVAARHIASHLFNKPRASNVIGERNAILNMDTEFSRRRQQLYGPHESVLGKIHLEMCKYHELGRFVPLLDNQNAAVDDHGNGHVEEGKIDWAAAFFHLQQAAHLCVTEALVNIGKIYMQVPRDILSTYNVEANDENYDVGFDYTLDAAENGDKPSLFFVARAFDTGVGLGCSKRIDWCKAVEYYGKLIGVDESTGSVSSPSSPSTTVHDISMECEADYVIMARIGEMHAEGLHGLERNLHEAGTLLTEAADKAIQFGKGRLANKYYMMAEKAFADAGEDDETPLSNENDLVSS